jgi:hypothetical protein
MSRRVRVPAPFQRLLPSVIRNIGPRLVIAAAGCALLLLVGGGTYLSHLVQTPPTPQPATPHAKPTDQQVLGANTVNAADTPNQTNAANTSSVASAPNANSAPDCSGNCTSTTPAPVPVPPSNLASFDLTVDTSAITLTGLSVPFSVTRHNGLHTPIIPGKVSIVAGGSLTTLITVQSATMTDADHGVLTFLTVGLFPHDINISFSAHSGSATANTNFDYHIGL